MPAPSGSTTWTDVVRRSRPSRDGGVHFKKCGTYTVETVSRTLSSAGRSSRTRSYASRDLIMPQEVMQDMRADDQIVFVRGQRPIRCGRAIFFRRRR